MGSYRCAKNLTRELKVRELCRLGCQLHERNYTMVPRIRGLYRDVRVRGVDKGIISSLQFNPLGITYLAITEGDFYLKSQFTLLRKVHKLMRRLYYNEPEIWLEREELDVREFLVCSRPFMKNVSHRDFTFFCRTFCHVNALRWEDVEALVTGDLTLKETAFQVICRLPLSHIRQYATRKLYKAVAYIQFIDRPISQEIMRDTPQ